MVEIEVFSADSFKKMDMIAYLLIGGFVGGLVGGGFAFFFRLRLATRETELKLLREQSEKDMVALRDQNEKEVASL